VGAEEVGAADLVEVAAQPVGAVDPVEVEAVVAMEAVSGVRFRPVSGLCDYLGCFFRYDPKRSFSSASCHPAKAKTSKEYESGRSRKCSITTTCRRSNSNSPSIRLDVFCMRAFRRLPRRVEG
jgi:hypothetical protein